MREILGKHEDFQNQTTLVEELIASRSHLCFFFPKFHCELNAIERVWCHAKNYARKYVNGSIVRLRTVVPQSLNTCDNELISKFKKNFFSRPIKGILLTCVALRKAVKAG